MKQVILVRKDLNMRRGKEIAQGAHAAMAFLLNAISEMNGGDPDAILENLTDWVNGGQTKICLGVENEEDLTKFYDQAIEAGLIAHIITDAGRTEFKGVATKTAVAIGPNNREDIDKITGHLKPR